MAEILNGKELAKELKDNLSLLVQDFKNETGVSPHLAVIIVGNDAASQTYVNGKIKACNYVGIKSTKIELNESASEKELIKTIEKLNSDASVHGILVQLPLPNHINEANIINVIDVSKDVDGFNPMNVANLTLGNKAMVPCTPKGIIRMIKSKNIDIQGKHAVIIGRSNIVGKPLAQLLLQENATVTICHSRTKDLAEHTKNADILIAAVGKKGIVRADMVKPGAIVIDVGINRDDENKLCGDVDFDDVKEVANLITPVPGGVGPMTITELLYNTLECAHNLSGGSGND